jgi:flagellar M-ring protein FliF
VFVRVRGNSQLPTQSINAIRFLVANSVEGLKANHVSVVDNLGNVLSENSDNDSITGMTGTQLTARRNLEQYLGKKAQDMLEKVLGPGQAIVRVSAEVNYDSISRTEEKFDPDGQVIRQQTKNDENTDSSTITTSSAAGISANTSTTTNAAANGPVNDSKNRKVTSTVDYEIGKITSSTVQAAGGIKRLTASVTVAAKMEGTGADRKVVNRSPEEMTKLRSLVGSAVGVDLARGDTMTLEELQFNDQFATEMTKELDLQQKHETWWNLARNWSFPALGLVALLILFRLFKQTPVQGIPIGVPVGRLLAHHNGNGNGNGHGKFGDPFETPPGVVTVEVLNKLVKENPANMTQAIRDWMVKGRTPENN